MLAGSSSIGVWRRCIQDVWSGGHAGGVLGNAPSSISSCNLTNLLEYALRNNGRVSRNPAQQCRRGDWWRRHEGSERHWPWTCAEEAAEARDEAEGKCWEGNLGSDRAWGRLSIIRQPTTLPKQLSIPTSFKSSPYFNANHTTRTRC